MLHSIRTCWPATLVAALTLSSYGNAQVAIRAETLHTMAGPVIQSGVVLIRDGKIAAVGPAQTITIPDSFRVIEAKVATPGLVDAHCALGLSGILNHPDDQDQLEHSSAIQPELRAIDAYNPHERLVEWVRSFGVTTMHTGHAPGELISGQTMVVKTTGNTVEDAILVETATVAATLGPQAQKREKGKSPGTRGKMMAMLRSEFIMAQEYLTKRETAEDDKKPDRNLRLDMMGRILKREIPLMVTADRAQDIASTLRLAREFDIKIILDSAAESYLLIDEIAGAKIPVIVHPSMARPGGELKNSSFETAAKLHHAGIPIAIQSGHEGYVPKTRVVLFEAAIATANGLAWNDALAAITIGAAKIIGVDSRVGSLEVGKDGDVALFDGDPLEYTTHCVGVIIDGKVVSDTFH